MPVTVSDSTTMLIGVYRAAAAVSNLQVIRTQNCPDCSGKGTVWMLGEEYPCVSCRTVEFEALCAERGIEPGMK